MLAVALSAQTRRAEAKEDAGTILGTRMCQIERRIRLGSASIFLQLIGSEVCPLWLSLASHRVGALACCVGRKTEPDYVQPVPSHPLEGSMWDKPKVLFLCTGHPERSEMAEGFLRALAKDAIQPISAAVEPAPLDPLAVDAMNEVGIDISHQIAKDVRTALQERFAYAVELGDKSEELGSVFPFAFRSFQWSLEDPLTVQGPTEQRLEAFRRVRNQIARKVNELVDLAYQDKLESLLPR